MLSPKPAMSGDNILQTPNKTYTSSAIGNQRCCRLLAPHLAEFFPSTVGRSLEFVAVKKFGKELGTENHKSKWTAR